MLATDGPVLMLAGAGTGKTKALTTRLAHLIATGKARPHEILAVTFTNRAAREMQHRVGTLVGAVVEGMPWLGTFHSVSARLLRRHAELVGLKSNFSILDSDDQLRLFKQALQLMDIDEKRWPARALAGIVDRWKNRGWTPDLVPVSDVGDFAFGKSLELYRAYQDRLATLNASDFGDLLLHTLTIFQKHPDVLQRYQQMFRYLLVDEYQDTNVCQYLWLRLLAQTHRNICCVGDDDQSIYSWRGAEVGNILRFEKDFPGATIIRLEQNYRSTPEILTAASGLIAANQGRLGKTLWTEGAGGEKVQVTGVWDGAEEARVVGENIESRIARGDSPAAMAILVRAAFQTREFEDRFITLGLPYRVVGGVRFYERSEIRDAIAYLRIVAQPDDDLAFERIINRPKRGLGDTSVQRIHQLARVQRLPMTRAARMLVETDELRGKARAGLNDLLMDIDRWRSEVTGLSPADLVRLVLEESGYVGALQADKSPESPGRLENLGELARAMEDYDGLTAFLDHVALVMDNEQASSGPQVSLMTLHAAKGLEFDTVFLAGWEEGVFPNQRSLDEGGLASLEEERRLAYVGITRARKSAHILHAANRRVYGQWQSSIPSRFIDELPADAIDMQTTMSGQTSLYRVSHDHDDPFADVARGSGRGPGWNRAQAAAASFPSSRAPRTAPKAQLMGGTRRSEFAVGERVFHEKFGYGVVTDVDGNKLDVDFESGSAKRVVDSFVKAA